MSRGDPHYFKLDMDALHGEKIGRLSVPELHTYEWGYWRMSVLRRSERIPCVLVTALELSRNCRTGVRVVPLHTRKLHNLGLITVWLNGDVTVHGTRARHARLEWNEYTPDDPVEELYRPCTGVVKITVQGIARQHDSTTDKIVPTPKEKIIENNSSGKKEEPELVSTIVDSPNPNQEYLRESKLASAVDDILLGFGMDSEKGEDRASVTSMYRSFPHRLVTDAYLVTKDRMYRAASGQEPPLDSPIAYMWTVLRGGRTDAE